MKKFVNNLYNFPKIWMVFALGILLLLLELKNFI